MQELRAAACRLLIYETAASRRFDVRDAAMLLHLQTLQLHRAKAEQRDQEELEHPQRLLRQPGRDPLLMTRMRHRRPCSGISNASAEGPAARWAAAQQPSASRAGIRSGLLPMRAQRSCRVLLRHGQSRSLQQQLCFPCCCVLLKKELPGLVNEHISFIAHEGDIVD